VINFTLLLVMGFLALGYLLPPLLQGLIERFPHEEVTFSVDLV
jgi:hypothetical protein